MDFNDELNNKNLYDEFGLVIQTGTAELLRFPKRKKTFEQDWRESNGKEYDLTNPVFEDKEVTLQCAIIADSAGQFWEKYDAFFNEIAQPGRHELYIDDHDEKLYSVFYVDSSNFQKTSKKLKGVSKIFVKFNLTLNVSF